MAYSQINEGFLIEAMVLNNDDGSTYDISNSIIDVMVQKKYSENILPLYVIDLKTTENIRNIIRDNDCVISLRISSYDINNTNNLDDTDDAIIAEKDIVFDKIIRLYDTPFETTAAKKEEDNDSDVSQKEAAPFIYYRVSGIPEDLIEKNKTIINNIYSNAKLNDVLVNILSNITKGNIFIQASDNNETLRDILIPPLSLSNTIYFLDNFYKIYKEGANLFIDDDTTYLYSIISNSLNHLNKLEIKVIDPEITSEIQNTKLPSYNSDTGDIRLDLGNVPPYSNLRKIAGDNVGTETIFYSYDDNFNIIKRGKTSDDLFKKVRYYWNSSLKEDYENEFYNDNLLSDSSIVNISNINPNYINPTTAVFINSQYPVINGEYVITEVSYIFTSKDLKFYKSSMNLTIVKK